MRRIRHRTFVEPGAPPRREVYLSDARIKAIMKMILEGIAHCHDMWFMHRVRGLTCLAAPFVGACARVPPAQCSVHTPSGVCMSSNLVGSS